MYVWIISLFIEKRACWHIHFGFFFFFLRIKTVPYLSVTVLATVKLNPVTAALPAFLVLLGKGRHPAIIYTQGWDAPAAVQGGDEQFRDTAKLRFQSREHTHTVPVPDNVHKIPYRQRTQTKPQQPQEISTEPAKTGGGRRRGDRKQLMGGKRTPWSLPGSARSNAFRFASTQSSH